MKLLPLALLLAASTAQADDDVAGWVNAGVGAAWREPAAQPPWDQQRLDYDTGTVLFAEVASHWRDGLLLRVDYAYTLYDELSAGGVSLAKDFEQHEARAAAFFAPVLGDGFGFRVGGGYVFHDEDVDQPVSEHQQDGGFIEAGLRFAAGRRVTFDLAALGLKVEGEGDDDAEGTEARARTVFHTPVVDVTVALRYRSLQREIPPDEDLYELRVGLGWDWDWDGRGIPDR